MKVAGTHYRSIWQDGATGEVRIIDQRWLPHDFRVVTLDTLEDFATAIRDMWVRGAPLIGATAAYGVALRDGARPLRRGARRAYDILHATRPTAINLRWALDEMRATLAPLPEADRAEAAFARAARLCDEDVEIEPDDRRPRPADHPRDRRAQAPGEPVNILTHCNAGWLATVDWGTATSPIYTRRGRHPVHVWVDETRPRNQGAQLTAWEMAGHGIPHT
jgi:methylthioribose-1-phosphate isomerase